MTGKKPPKGSHVIWQSSVCALVQVKRCDVMTCNHAEVWYLKQLGYQDAQHCPQQKAVKVENQRDTGIWAKWVVGLGVTYL